MKGDKDLIRIVALAGAFLIMFIIIGISVYSINHIDDMNQKNREVEQGKQFAATIAQTTPTTSIWDYLRSTTAPTIDKIIVSDDNQDEPDDEASNLEQGNENQEQTSTATIIQAE